jgi:hypothetical protein
VAGAVSALAVLLARRAQVERHVLAGRAVHLALGGLALGQRARLHVRHVPHARRFPRRLLPVAKRQ